MKTTLSFLFVSMAVLSGCAVAPVGTADDGAETAGSSESVGVTQEASTLYGVQQVSASCTPPAFNQPASWPTPFYNWYAVYGSFDNGGANVSAFVVATFSNGDPPLALGYYGSNYRSGSQVNLEYGGTHVGGCPSGYHGTIYDGGVVIGSF